MDLESALAYMKEHGFRGRVNNALVISRALDRGVTVRPDRKGRVQLRKGRRKWLFHNGWSNLNHRLVTRCATQKEITSRLLRARGLPAPENAYFGADDIERAWAWAEPVLPVVVKPSDLSKGDAVHVDIKDRGAFEGAFNVVVRRSGGALIEVLGRGVEHRITTIDGEIAAATKRLPAHVVGDGITTIEGLVALKNQQRESSGNPVHKLLKLDAVAIEQMTRQGLTSTSVPESGVHVALRATSNVSTGGDAVDATDDLRPDEAEIVRQAARAIPGLRIAGFDVLLPRGSESSGPSIIEVNTAPMISMHHYPWTGQPRDVADRILDAMFVE
ncbi:hypothetical protein [Phytoactinopolyspora mesophila]|uniref:ATP-grasp domain-containing protein n=1 Tax=Phytoactinopolyspora mesophila TaxID=2650750 RepID=A0A7K3M3E2_9ACTN|nr:hypothetical protein [Phytoactinopolyspora mesophila]NDL57422.1 hypothetical protein [Phytoactinopolyspora mesophila]